jgi:polysaccharide pyruvyl transferase WcaK-like protein
MATSDIVVSIAGGDSFSDLYGPVRFFYVSLPQIVALLLGKKLVLLPQTLGPFKRRTTKIVARYILNRSHLVFSRDRRGMEEMREFLGNGAGAGRLKFCYDAGFLMEPEKPGTIGLPEHVVQRVSGRPLVGVNVSGLLLMGGYTKDNMFGLRTDYRVLVRDLIGMFVTEMGADVVLVPHVFGESPESESDLVACREIFREFAGKHGDRIFFPDARYDQNEIKYIIGLCDFFVGSRMHACIAALSQNIPAVSIAYSRKFHGVLQTIGAEDLVADPRTMEEGEILRIVRDGFRRREAIRKHLERVIPSVKSAVNGLFDPRGPLFQ